MAKLFLYFVCTLAFLTLGGASNELVADTQDSKIIYLDFSALDSDDGSSDLDTALSSLYDLVLPSQKIHSDYLYGFFANAFSIQSFHIRAPPHFS